MPNPRPHSIVKLTTIEDVNVQTFDLKLTDRFVYLGEIAQDPTKCVVIGLGCGKRIPYLNSSVFVEVDADDF